MTAHLTNRGSRSGLNLLVAEPKGAIAQRGIYFRQENARSTWAILQPAPLPFPPLKADSLFKLESAFWRNIHDTQTAHGRTIQYKALRSGNLLSIGLTVSAASKQIEVTQQTYYKWCNISAAIASSLFEAVGFRNIWK